MCRRIRHPFHEADLIPERFELPEVDSFREGKTTIIKNFTDIANTLHRDPEHILRFLSKELAAPGNIDGNRLIMQRVLRRRQIQAKLQEYMDEYVICNECGRPDTEITELEGEKIIKCAACGGWWPLRKIK